MFSLRRPQLRLILKYPYFDPLCSGYLLRPWLASAGHNDLLMNLHGDDDPREKPVEETETAEPCQND